MMESPLGLPTGLVAIAPYNPAWPQLFEAEKAVLRKEVFPDAGESPIEHVGSTAVPGLDAKPILDIAIAVPDLAVTVARIQAPLAALGYGYKGEYGLPGREFFVKGEQQRTHHLHIVAAGSPHWEAWLRFRDTLRTHPEIADQYERVKQDLARRFARDRESYTAGKSAFVESILAGERHRRPRP